MRKALKVLLVLPLMYLLLLAGFFVAMCQRPEVFAGLMARTPGVAFMILPFKPMWLTGRAASLKVGDQAPELALAAHDRKSDFRLSDLKGKRPVVLVFGS